MLRYICLIVAIVASLLLPQQMHGQEARPLRWFGYMYGGESVTDNYTALFRQGFTSLEDVDSYWWRWEAVKSCTTGRIT